MPRKRCEEDIVEGEIQEQLRKKNMNPFLKL